jgi:hypothetical protein
MEFFIFYAACGRGISDGTRVAIGKGYRGGGCRDCRSFIFLCGEASSGSCHGASDVHHKRKGFIREDGENKAELMRLSQGALNLIGSDATRLRLRHRPRNATGASITPAHTRFRRLTGRWLHTELLAELNSGSQTDMTDPAMRTLIGAR